MVLEIYHCWGKRHRCIDFCVWDIWFWRYIIVEERDIDVLIFVSEIYGFGDISLLRKETSMYWFLCLRYMGRGILIFTCCPWGNLKAAGGCDFSETRGGCEAVFSVRENVRWYSQWVRKNGVKGLVTSIDTYNIIIIFKGIGYRFLHI